MRLEDVRPDTVEVRLINLTALPFGDGKEPRWRFAFNHSHNGYVVMSADATAADVAEYMARERKEGINARVV